MEVSKIEASLETWKLDLENSIFDEMALLEGVFFGNFSGKKIFDEISRKDCGGKLKNIDEYRIDRFLNKNFQVILLLKSISR